MIAIQYSFATKTIADNRLKDLKGTIGIVHLGFQDVWSYDVETQKSILVKKGLTYDVDILWENEASEAFKEYEVHPTTPNHSFIL